MSIRDRLIATALPRYAGLAQTMALAGGDTIPIRTILTKAGGVNTLRDLPFNKALTLIRKAASDLSTERKKAGKIWQVDMQDLTQWAKDNCTGKGKPAAKDKSTEEHPFNNGDRHRNKVTQIRNGYQVGNSTLKKNKAGGFDLKWQVGDEVEAFTINSKTDIPKVTRQIKKDWASWVQAYKDGDISKAALRRCHDSYGEYVALIEKAAEHFNSVKDAPAAKQEDKGKPSSRTRPVGNARGPGSDTSAPATYSAAHVPATYEEAKKKADKLNSDVSAAAKALSAFLDKHPKGAFGLTPDDVKATTAYKKLKAAYDRAFQLLRTYNEKYVKQYAKERKADKADRDRRVPSSGPGEQRTGQRPEQNFNPPAAGGKASQNPPLLSHQEKFKTWRSLTKPIPSNVSMAEQHKAGVKSLKAAGVDSKAADALQKQADDIRAFYDKLNIGASADKWEQHGDEYDAKVKKAVNTIGKLLRSIGMPASYAADYAATMGILPQTELD
jgi:hypothetical protein